MERAETCSFYKRNDYLYWIVLVKLYTIVVHRGFNKVTKNNITFLFFCRNYAETLPLRKCVPFVKIRN
jgi:hypothetical protein